MKLIDHYRTLKASIDHECELIEEGGHFANGAYGLKIRCAFNMLENGLGQFEDIIIEQKVKGQEK